MAIGGGSEAEDDGQQLASVMDPNLLSIMNNSLHRILILFSESFLGLFICAFIVRDDGWETLSDVKMKELWKLLMIYAVCLFSYMMLQGSDPGYILQHKDAVDSLDKSSDISLNELENQAIEESIDESSPALIYNNNDFDSTATQLHPANRRKASRALIPTDCLNTVEFCKYCCITKPIRAHHCRICNRCVSKFDHHCIFLHTCIGEKNHCRFLCFILVHLYGIFYCWMMCIYSLTYSMAAVLLFILLSCLLLLVISLAGFHTWLAISATSSIECAKSSRIYYLRDTGDFDLPFAHCFLWNLYDFCCCRDAASIWVWGIGYNIWYGLRLCCYQCGCRVDGLFRLLSLRVIPTEQQLGESVYPWYDVRWSTVVNSNWKPRKWSFPGPIVRDSEDICAHPWQNKYYSCC